MEAAGRDQRFVFAITTNGTICNEESLSVLRMGRFNVILSIDGPPHVHDKVRSTSSGMPTHAGVMRFLRELRSAGFNGVLITGGHGASMSPKVLLENGADAVVCGEGEITFRELLQHGISEKVSGLYLMRYGALIKTPQRPLIQSLDSLQEPARDLAGEPPDGIFLLETSRGCPHGCTFCETTRFHGRRWRARSPELVAEDICHLVSSHGAVIIQIADDNFMASPVQAFHPSGALLFPMLFAAHRLSA